MVLVSAEYQVFGKVQGVFFRKHTLKAATKSYELVGWVKNAEDGTVIGVIQGASEKVKDMKKWLKTKGSPHCRIDKCEFKNEKTIEKLEFTDFKVEK